MLIFWQSSLSVLHLVKNINIAQNLCYHPLLCTASIKTYLRFGLYDIPPFLFSVGIGLSIYNFDLKTDLRYIVHKPAIINYYAMNQRHITIRQKLVYVMNTILYIFIYIYIPICFILGGIYAMLWGFLNNLEYD